MDHIKILPPELITKESLKLLPYLTWKEYRDQYEQLVDDADKSLKLIINRLLKDYNLERAGNGLLPDAIKQDEVYKRFNTHFKYCFEVARNFNRASPKKYQQRASKEYREAKFKKAKES